MKDYKKEDVQCKDFGTLHQLEVWEMRKDPQKTDKEPAEGQEKYLAMVLPSALIFPDLEAL